MNKKEFYTSPEVEAFEVRYEGVVCTSKTGSSGFNENGDITDRSSENWGW